MNGIKKIALALGFTRKRSEFELLETENPAPKKRKKTYVYRTPYKQGDVIAFPVKERWVYFHVCGIKRSK